VRALLALPWMSRSVRGWAGAGGSGSSCGRCFFVVDCGVLSIVLTAVVGDNSGGGLFRTDAVRWSVRGGRAFFTTFFIACEWRPRNRNGGRL